MIVREGLARCLAGLVVGAVAALASTRLLSSLLYGVRPSDPLIFAGVFGTLLAVALAASLLPARRAASVDPWKALRTE
jgi:ABC-type antimicrobial peptide transport system permease subunit